MAAETSEPLLQRYSQAEMPTTFGPLTLVVYRVAQPQSFAPGAQAEREHLAVVAGPVTASGQLRDAEDVLARVHSECWTGEVLGSLKCDCRAQFDSACDAIARAGRGVVVYLRQEGRGIGLGNK